MQIIINFDEPLNLNYFKNKYKKITEDQYVFILNKGLLLDKKIELNDNNFLLVNDYVKFNQLKNIGYDRLNDESKNKYKQLENKLMKGGIL